MQPRPWAFPGRLAPATRTPGELSLILHRAIGELRRAARLHPLRAGEGAVTLCELLPPATGRLGLWTNNEGKQPATVEFRAFRILP